MVAYTFYHSLTSPYARKVRVMLLEKQVQFEAINVAESARPVAEHNPLGKVPTLILDDGTVLYDSSVITETLELMHPEPELIPTAPRERAVVRRWEALADGLCDVLIPVVLESRRAPEHQDAAYIAKLEGKVRAGFDHLERHLDGRDCVGSLFSLADIAIVCALGYVNLRRPELLQGREILERYVRHQLARPSLAETVPPNLPVRG